MYNNKINEIEEMFSIESTELGRWEQWGGRVFLQDALGGFSTLREQMVNEIGPEFAAAIFYRAGFAASENLMAFVNHHDESGDGEAHLKSALDLLTQGGYGRLRLEEEHTHIGEITVHVEDSLEGDTMRNRSSRTGYVCDYLRGLLRGIVEALPDQEGYPEGLVDCVEICCLANGDADCRFIIAEPTHLSRHGYRASDSSHSTVRETLLRLNRQLEDVLEAAKRDSLTGLYNRAHFEAALQHRIEFASRRTDTLAVAMIDMDGFKGVNDTQGHGMGDLALRQIGHLLAAQARETDLVARYGGDEFAWLMPGTSMEAALMVADRIRKRVIETREEMDLPISLSIGIASYPEDADNLTDLIDRADAAMYGAKNAGGNQVRRYIEAEDHRSATQKRVRKPRPRGEAAPLPKPSPDADILRLDFNE